MIDYPVEFMFAVSQNESSMRNFIMLDDGKRAALLARVSKCRSRGEIEAVAFSLSDDTSANKYS